MLNSSQMSAIQQGGLFLIVTIFYGLSDLLDRPRRRVMAFKIEKNPGDSPDTANGVRELPKCCFINGDQ